MATQSGNSDQQLLTQMASFIQHSLPGLEAGRYQISVQQELKKSAADGGADIAGEGLPFRKSTFGIAGPRYSLDQNAIRSVYPPRNSLGEFSNSLAHVVLNQPKTPWIRSPYTPADTPARQVLHYQTSIQGKTVTIDYDQDVPTWMAVLLVSPSDLGGADITNVVRQGVMTDLAPTTMQVQQGNNPALPGTMPAHGYSIFSYLLEGGATPQPVDPGIGFNPATVVHYIDLPCALFNAIVPSMGDLSMMAHIREVQMKHKPIPYGQAVNPTEQYSIVLGNRLPESQPPAVPGKPAAAPPLGANLAVLVSLEAMKHALRDHGGSTYYDTHISGQPDGFVRLIALYQWTFTSLQDTAFDFETILESLNGRDPKAPATTVIADPLLRLPKPPVYKEPSNDQAVVEKMFASGYFPMNHLARIPGGANNQPIQTLAWYRGPLIPPGAYTPRIEFMSGNDPATAIPLIYAADQLLRFDPATGLYDVSYAVAWELGRLLSLQNLDFSIALYRWKKQVAQQYRVLLDSQVLENMYGALVEGYQAAVRKETPANPSAHLVLHQTALHHLNKIALSL